MPKAIKKGAITMSIASHRAYLNGRDLLLSVKEFDLLSMLTQNEGVILSSEEIYEHVWNQPMLGDNRSLKKCIYSLRDKLAEGESEYNVTSVYGKGYRYEKNNPFEK